MSDGIGPLVKANPEMANRIAAAAQQAAREFEEASDSGPWYLPLHLRYRIAERVMEALGVSS